MGILDSLQNSLLRQSDIGKRLKQPPFQESGHFQMPQPQSAPMSNITKPKSPQTVLPTNLSPRVGGVNPFLKPNSTDIQSQTEGIGVNKPLQQPMFIGYHDEKPIYGGGKVFILA